MITYYQGQGDFCSAAYKFKRSDDRLSSCSSDSNDDDDDDDDESLRQELGAFSVRHWVTAVAVSDLLVILQPFFPFLRKDARTLLLHVTFRVSSTQVDPTIISV